LSKLLIIWDRWGIEYLKHSKFTTNETNIFLLN
jgi:hypothetical protein